MLEDLANNPLNLSVQFSSVESFEIPEESVSVFKTFYDACNEAGIFNQPELYEFTDDYSIRTLFNEGSSGTEDVNEEAMLPASSENEQTD